MSVRHRLIAAALAGAATPAMAGVGLPATLSDHAVIQRGTPIPIWGTGTPRTRVTITFNGRTARSVVGADGRWRAQLPAMKAGGPYRLDVTSSDGSRASADDILVGDVWLCSGQSNMEYPLRRTLDGDGEVAEADDPQLRLMKVERQLADSAQASFAKAPQWQRSTPGSARDFSAACFIMAKDLRDSGGVAIGAIDDSWGGTPVRAWMSEGAARASGNAEPAALLDAFRRDRPTALRQFGEQWGAWWRGQTGDKPGEEPWNAPGRLAWKQFPSMAYWNDWGGDWPKFDGPIWAYRTVDLSAAEAAQGATLSLGVIDDMDQSWINGVAVGGSSDPAAPRVYKIAPGVLRAGRNNIVVYARDLWGPGGFKGPAEVLELTLADGSRKPLGTGWRYTRMAENDGPPVPPWGNSSGVSTIYNAMVAPLGPIRLTGVAWYQGEADVGQAGYDRRLSAMMANWRTQFGDPKLPFLIVGLAAWGKPSATPTDSGWAATIDEQRRAVVADRRSALVSAIDLGEWNDIHPANKTDLGHRLAWAANTLIAGGKSGKVGPLPLRAVRQGGDVVVTFSKPLQALSSSRPIGFELCAATCRYAEASIEGATVRLSGTGTSVRYAWADAPVVNLYDLDLLPAPVFQIPVQ
ncbi:9-O-acetylesterase [Sphingomonas rhizophila]|uniref:9-O-acetylesterase n=1 Tax=Sphingomonas rhizophila TaxID=2071607 RepID=A0A7G9SBB5_9SPHN|nr:sialate O-acetylesterase [Sphingomonas rhizophila]QNN65140.1 9-O-acetylesterase [Sphingomonas rhizophila]